MKNKGVCKGCKYFKEHDNILALRNICEYAEKTGCSRLKIEQENGGYRKDSCVCYDAGKHRSRGVIPWGFKRGVNDEGKNISEAN